MSRRAPSEHKVNSRESRGSTSTIRGLTREPRAGDGPACSRKRPKGLWSRSATEALCQMTVPLPHHAEELPEKFRGRENVDMNTRDATMIYAESIANGPTKLCLDLFPAVTGAFGETHNTMVQHFGMRETNEIKGLMSACGRARMQPPSWRSLDETGSRLCSSQDTQVRDQLSPFWPPSNHAVSNPSLSNTGWVGLKTPG